MTSKSLLSKIFGVTLAHMTCLQYFLRKHQKKLLSKTNLGSETIVLVFDVIIDNLLQQIYYQPSTASESSLK